VVLTFAGAPERTMSLMFRVEGGLCNVSVGGNEGLGPIGLGEEEVLKFAREVRYTRVQVSCQLVVGSAWLNSESLHHSTECPPD